MPVATTVMPARVWGTAAASRSSAKSTPAAAHVSTICLCQGTSNHVRKESAMTGPTPSSSDRSSGLAVAAPSSEP